MKFSTVVGNPPFGHLHLKIIDSVIPQIEKGGTGCFIHPARWYEDPVARYKKNSDQGKFTRLLDRLEDVRILETGAVETTFGITRNGDLMISWLSPNPAGKKIEIYDDKVRKTLDVILPYSKSHNLEEHIDKNKVDGWRVQIKALTAIDPHIHSMSETDRKGQCNVFGGNKFNVFFNGFDGDVEWMNTRRQTTGKKVSGAPLPYSIKFGSEEEARNFEKSCNTKFYQNIMYLLKCDMHSPLKYLPWMGDYTHPWSDEDYCRYFGALGLSQECQKWMCREVYDYRTKDFLKKEYINNYGKI
ncbi:MAG: hypothetical protein II659_08490 [Bacteroidales bacterium]|nr:hypothetical protein [Bacteroidales bacterium]